MMETPKEIVKRWFVVLTQQHQEKTARIHLLRQRFDVYLPLRAGHPKAKNPFTPFFPGYLFVQFAPEVTQWLSICGTVGVRDVIRRSDGTPQPLPAGAVEWIREQEIDGVLPALAKKRRAAEAKKLEPGQLVRVVDGKLRGLEGIFEAVVDSDRVAVLLQVMGRETRVEMHVSDLKGSCRAVAVQSGVETPS